MRALTRAITCIDRGLAAGVEGNKVRLSATSAVAAAMEEEQTLIITAGCYPVVSNYCANALLLKRHLFLRASCPNIGEHRKDLDESRVSA